MTHFEQSIHITVDLSKEDRQRLDEVIAFLGLIVGQKYSTPESALAAFDKGIIQMPVNEHPVDEVSPHVVPEPDPDQLSFFDQAPTKQVNYSKEDVQALVLKLAAPSTGKKDAVKAIVNEYAKKVSDIPEDKLNEVMAKLNQLAEEE